MRKTLFILGILLVFIFYTPASSQEDVQLSQFKDWVDAQGLKIICVSSLEFKPVLSEHYQTFEWILDNTGLTVPNGNPDPLVMLAQFHLPDGAEIKRVVAMYYDNSAAANINCGIERVEPFDISEPEPMVFFTSDGLADVDALRILQTTTILDPIIDNRNVYWAVVEFDELTMGDVYLRAIWIAYE